MGKGGGEGTKLKLKQSERTDDIKGRQRRLYIYKKKAVRVRNLRACERKKGVRREKNGQAVTGTVILEKVRSEATVNDC